MDFLRIETKASEIFHKEEISFSRWPGFQIFQRKLGVLDMFLLRRAYTHYLPTSLTVDSALACVRRNPVSRPGGGICQLQ